MLVKIKAKRKTDISDFKFECDKMLITKFCYHDSNFRRKSQAVLEYAFRESDKNTPLTPPSPPLSKDEALKNIEHSMSIRNLIFGVKSVKVSYMIGYDSLLQMRQKFITKWVRFFITKCDVYYKLWQYTHKACWHVKQVSVLANHIGTLTRIPRCQE